MSSKRPQLQSMPASVVPRHIDYLLGINHRRSSYNPASHVRLPLNVLWCSYITVLHATHQPYNRHGALGTQCATELSVHGSACMRMCCIPHSNIFNYQCRCLILCQLLPSSGSDDVHGNTNAMCMGVHM